MDLIQIPEAAITIRLSAGPVLAIVAGVAILIWPKFLNYIVAGYLIIIGVLGLVGGF